MSGNDTPERKAGDVVLITALATGVSVPVAARRAGVSEATAYRRLRDPKFRRSVIEARDRLLNEVVGRLLSAAGKAVAALVASLKDDDPRVRNRAALGILQNLVNGVSAQDLKAEVAELRGRLDPDDSGQKRGGKP